MSDSKPIDYYNEELTDEMLFPGTSASSAAEQAINRASWAVWDDKGIKEKDKQRIVKKIVIDARKQLRRPIR